MKGQVLRSTGSWYEVKLEGQDAIVSCRLRGKLRLDESKNTNPVAVGDLVMVDRDEGDDTYVIDEVLDRKNYMLRRSPKHRHARHIIAANIDLAMLVATVAKPRTSTGFIDRFLVTAEAYDIPAQLVFNKQDILRPKDLAKQEEMVELYREIGYPVLLSSAETGEGIEALKEIMQDKLTLISGHSGVGKSTIINLLHPDLDLRTKDLTKKTQKGAHTTTFAEMHELPFGGYIIDTPGIKEFGLLDMEPWEVSHYFPEMVPFLDDCQFNNCLHLEEPGCAVREALETGAIHFERYKNYVNMVFDAQEEPKHYE